MAESYDVDALIGNIREIQRNVREGQDVVQSLHRLRTKLAERSLMLHNQANKFGKDTILGAKAESQSHAYANASMWLGQILDNTN